MGALFLQLDAPDGIARAITPSAEVDLDAMTFSGWSSLVMVGNLGDLVADKERKEDSDATLETLSNSAEGLSAGAMLRLTTPWDPHSLRGSVGANFLAGWKLNNFSTPSDDTGDVEESTNALNQAVFSAGVSYESSKWGSGQTALLRGTANYHHMSRDEARQAIGIATDHLRFAEVNASLPVGKTRSLVVRAVYVDGRKPVYRLGISLSED